MLYIQQLKFWGLLQTVNERMSICHLIGECDYYFIHILFARSTLNLSCVFKIIKHNYLQPAGLI